MLKFTPPRLASRCARCFADPPPPGEVAPWRGRYALRMLFLLGGERLAAGAFELGCIGLAHLRRQPVLGQFLRELLTRLGVLIAVVDLVAAGAFADPRLRYALGVADRNALVLEGEITRRCRPGVE